MGVVIGFASVRDELDRAPCRSGVGEMDFRPGLGEGAHLAVESLRVGGRPDHSDDHGLAGVGDHWRERGGGVGLGAVAEHHVEEYDGGVVGSQRPLEVVEPQGRVDHRMGPSRGECVVAEVHHRVGVCGQVGTQSQVGRQGDVAPDRTQLFGRDQHRLVAQRAADEQPAQPAAAALPCERPVT